MKPTAFDAQHPSIALAYFGAVLVLAMAAPHPLLLAISFAAALLCGAWLRGGGRVAKSLAWQLPLIAIIVAINPLFSSTGTTELFRIGTQAVYAEGYANAATMALLLVCVMQWFSNADAVLGSDKVMGALGRVLPTVGLMLSMVMRLIPRFVRRGRTINATLGACTAARCAAPATACTPLHKTANTAERQPAGPGAASAESQTAGSSEASTESQTANASTTVAESQAAAANITTAEYAEPSPETAKHPRRARFSDQLRTVTTLMGWSMEDSLEAADSMRCRGWGASRKRTTFQRQRFRARDGALLAVLALFAAAAAVAAWQLMQGFGFFPALHGTLASPLACATIPLLCFPLVLELLGKVRR